ncbi:MAG TPA: hypothetical protein VGO59_16300 [Verrucomicrobiae bacterium]|jgi:hypothetical protein
MNMTHYVSGNIGAPSFKGTGGRRETHFSKAHGIPAPLRPGKSQQNKPEQAILNKQVQPERPGAASQPAEAQKQPARLACAGEFFVNLVALVKRFSWAAPCATTGKTSRNKVKQGAPPRTGKPASPIHYAEAGMRSGRTRRIAANCGGLRYNCLKYAQKAIIARQSAATEL